MVGGPPPLDIIPGHLLPHPPDIRPRDLNPASDIWWWSRRPVQTCTFLYLHPYQSGIWWWPLKLEAYAVSSHWTVRILLECFLVIMVKIPSKGTRSSQVVLFTLKTAISKIMDIKNVCISVGQVEHYDLNQGIIRISEVGNERIRFTIASHPEGVKLAKLKTDIIFSSLNLACHLPIYLLLFTLFKSGLLLKIFFDPRSLLSAKVVILCITWFVCHMISESHVWMRER